MTFEEFKKVKVGSQCVIIKTGEPGSVLSVNNGTGDVLLQAKRAGRGVTKEWFHYIQLGKL
jgi:hypothetical protein